MTSAGRADIAGRTATLLASMRAARPLVHNIANYVSMDVAANALLAIGASPAMVHAREEVAEFVGLSAALVVNIGTLSTPWIEAMIIAAEAAKGQGKPWVLDPVGAGATTLRNEAVKMLLPHRPSIIRGNASEIMAVAGGAGVAPKGVDSANTTQEALAFALSLAEHEDCIVVATGAVDIVTDGRRVVKLANGSPMMAKVTALAARSPLSPEHLPLSPPTNSTRPSRQSRFMASSAKSPRSRRRARARIAWPFSMGSSRSDRRRSRVACGSSTDAWKWRKILPALPGDR